MTHYMNLQPNPFYAIQSKEKDIELRLLDEKRQLIQIGDVIEFTNTEDGSCKLTACVIGLHKFPSIEKLYASLPLLRCGYTEENVAQASPSDMELYYSKERQEKYGVVGIEIELK